MMLTIELPDETAAILKARAGAEGVSESGLVAQLLSPTVRSAPYIRRSTPQERLRRFEAFIATLSADTAPLSDEAVSRTSIYP